MAAGQVKEGSEAEQKSLGDLVLLRFGQMDLNLKHSWCLYSIEVATAVRLDFERCSFITLKSDHWRELKAHFQNSIKTDSKPS